jgi:hypothetical protein
MKSLQSVKNPSRKKSWQSYLERYAWGNGNALKFLTPFPRPAVLPPSVITTFTKKLIPNNHVNDDE